MCAFPENLDVNLNYHLFSNPDNNKNAEILEEVYHPRQMRLKGQMLSVPEWSAYIFLATPM